MRRIVDQLAKEQFVYERPQLNMADACISVRMGKNAIYEGSLTLEVKGGRYIKGTIYSSSARVTLRDYTIAGNRVDILYTINSIGLEPGEELKGALSLVTDGGEYEVPFFVKIVKIGSDSSMGSVKNLFHFTNLAYTDYEEAYHVFSSESFSHIFTEEEDAERTLYECFKRTGLSKLAMEEFLIGIHKKKRSVIRLGAEKTVVTDVTETIRSNIPLEKENWGYICADVSTDAPFIILDKKQITSDDFAGKYYEFPFLVNVHALHAGKNYGTIRIRTKGEDLKFRVEVSRPTTLEARKARSEYHHLQDLKVRLMRTYEKYKAEELSEDLWVAQSLVYLEELAVKERTNPYYTLLRGYFYHKSGEHQKARQMLAGFSKGEPLMKDPVFYSTYAYIASILQKEKSVRRQAYQNTLTLYERHRECWQLLWILLQMEEFRFEGAPTLLQYMEEQIEAGCASPAFLAESFLLYREYPQLLKRMNKSQMKIFLWAEKYDLVEEPLANLVGTLAVQSRYTGKMMLRLLTKLYERHQTETLLNAIVSCLVRGGFSDRRYFKWYKAGVEKDLKITGLYEAYIHTVDEKLRKRLPLPLVLYFEYNNTLDFRKKAFLYANLFQYRKSYGNVFRQFEPQIEKFVTEQLMERRIDQNLAKLYNGFLQEDMLTKELAKALIGMLFLHEVRIPDSHMQAVTAVHKYVDTWQTVPVTDGCAYVNIFMEDCKLVFVDDRGELYVTPEAFELRQLIDTERFLPACEAFFPEEGMITMYRCCGKSDSYEIHQENVSSFSKLVNLTFVEPAFKEKVRGDILSFYYNNYDVDDLEETLFDINPSGLNSEERVRLVEIYIARKMHDRAFELIREFGYEKIEPRKLVPLCSRMIRRAEYLKEPYLLNLCHYTFTCNKYDETILQYLCDYYNGSSAQMLELYEAAENFGMNTHFLKERILIRRMFSGICNMNDFDVFENYMRSGGNEQVEKAYLIFHSGNYFGDKEAGLPEFFEWQEKKYKEIGIHSDVCKLALLKYYAEHPELQSQKAPEIRALLDEMACGDHRFAFYQKFPDHILEPYFIRDKYFVEHRTVPGRKVYLHYQLLAAERDNTGVKVTEKLPEVFPGIYNKEFTLFYGDELVYFISEEQENGKEISTNDVRICHDDVFLSQSRDKYHLINDMLICQDLHDSLTLRELQSQYKYQETLVHAFFHMDGADPLAENTEELPEQEEEEEII